MSLVSLVMTERPGTLHSPVIQNTSMVRQRCLYPGDVRWHCYAGRSSTTRGTYCVRCRRQCLARPVPKLRTVMTWCGGRHSPACSYRGRSAPYSAGLFCCFDGVGETQTPSCGPAPSLRLGDNAARQCPLRLRLHEGHTDISVCFCLRTCRSVGGISAMLYCCNADWLVLVWVWVWEGYGRC